MGQGGEGFGIFCPTFAFYSISCRGLNAFKFFKNWYCFWYIFYIFFSTFRHQVIPVLLVIVQDHDVASRKVRRYFLLVLLRIFSVFFPLHIWIYLLLLKGSSNSIIYGNSGKIDIFLSFLENSGKLWNFDASKYLK